MTTATSNSFLSIGQACALLQRMPKAIESAAVELGIVPALKLNMIDHYAEEDVQRIGDHLRAAKAKGKAN